MDPTLRALHGLNNARKQHSGYRRFPREKTGTERLSNLPKVTQLVREEPGFESTLLYKIITCYLFPADIKEGDNIMT